MKEEDVKKWIKKAENDLKVARDEINTQEPATDTICFHCQQCIEKYLKAYLVFHRKIFRKTHDLSEIINLCKEIDIDFDKLRDFRVHELTIYATELRYPEYFFEGSGVERR
ncbi:MAG: HEPN domain-containing protein [bacterium]|nr:HEPN domain-containing protein [bacterium]